MRERLHTLFFILMFLIHGSIAYFIERDQTTLYFISFYSLVLFWFLSWFDPKFFSGHYSGLRIVMIGLLMRAIYLIAIPAMSDDVFRYLWDGHLCLQGVSPFQFTPMDWMRAHPDFGASYLYPLLNSKPYYSVYPPVQQAIYCSVAFIGGHGLELQIIVFRCIAILAELGSMLLILKLLDHYRKPYQLLLLYALNPLIIIEFVGNLHGEVFMVFFMLLFLWWHLNGRVFPAAVAFAMAVLTKLLPLIFLPAIIWRSKPKKYVSYLVTLGVLVFVCAQPFITPDSASNMFSSLQKYFINFEFNASIYYVIREVGYWWKGWNIIAEAGKILPIIVFILIMAQSFWKRRSAQLATVFMFCWMTYYLFSTTVHPWYIAVLVPFSIFSEYRSAFLWTLLVPLSYHAYSDASVEESTLMLCLEYFPVFIWLAYEFGWLRHLERIFAKQKAQVKFRRLKGFYSVGDRVLDVGVGSGSLAHVLQANGISVMPVDVVDKSLFKEIRPKLYSGLDLKETVHQKTDAVQMITMLHHVSDPDRLIEQASEIASKLIVMEDVYSSSLQQLMTHVADSIMNLEFIGHPHTNRTDSQWRETFSRSGYELRSFSSERFLFFFRRNTYLLEHPSKD